MLSGHSHHEAHLPAALVPADPDGRMGEYAIQAAEATYRQALSVGLNATKVRHVQGCRAPGGTAGMPAWAQPCMIVHRHPLSLRLPVSSSQQHTARQLQLLLSLSHVPRIGSTPPLVQRPCPTSKLPGRERSLCCPSPPPVPQIGNTPMIGRNDVETEVFYQADAHKVISGSKLKLHRCTQPASQCANTASEGAGRTSVLAGHVSEQPCWQSSVLEPAASVCAAVPCRWHAGRPPRPGSAGPPSGRWGETSERLPQWLRGLPAPVQRWSLQLQPQSCRLASMLPAAVTCRRPRP